MTRRNRLLLPAALAIALAAVLLVPACRWRVVGWARGEAFYRGRPTSYWRAEFQRARRSAQGRFVVMEMGPQTWLDQLKQWTGVFHYDVAFIMPAYLELEGGADAAPVLTQLVADPDPDIRAYAAETLGKLGPEATASVPALREASHDQSPTSYEQRTVGEFASDALKAIDPEAAKAAGVE